MVQSGEGLAMHQARIVKRIVLCLGFIGVSNGSSTAAPSLLVEIHNTGLMNLTSGQPEMGFSFNVGVQGSQWLFFATQADVGKTFSAPTELLPLYNQRLMSDELAFVYLTCCETNQHGIVIPPLHNQNIIDGFISAVRLAPSLGPNLSGYRITDITQTIDDITITHVADIRYNRSGAHTIRIYGEPVPEPTAFVLGLLGLAFNRRVVR
jgi:hypothetical protein